jgi:hypothetical protein
MENRTSKRIDLPKAKATA